MVLQLRSPISIDKIINIITSEAREMKAGSTACMCVALMLKYYRRFILIAHCSAGFLSLCKNIGRIMISILMAKIVNRDL